MIDENDVLVTQLRKVVATNGQRAAREGMMIGWWLRDFKLITPPEARRPHLYRPKPGVMCQCEMCKWQRGEQLW